MNCLLCNERTANRGMILIRGTHIKVCERCDEIIKRDEPYFFPSNELPQVAAYIDYINKLKPKVKRKERR